MAGSGRKIENNATGGARLVLPKVWVLRPEDQFAHDFANEEGGSWTSLFGRRSLPNLRSPHFRASSAMPQPRMCSGRSTYGKSGLAIALKRPRLRHETDPSWVDHNSLRLHRQKPNSVSDALACGVKKRAASLRLFGSMEKGDDIAFALTLWYVPPIRRSFFGRCPCLHSC